MRLSAFCASAITVCAILAAAPARAGDVDWPVNTRVNGHAFDRVRVKRADCALEVRLDFAAPEEGYSARAKNRNVHRFRARLLFKSGKVVTTLPFNNRGPGRRMYSEVVDTSGDACWAKDELRLKDVEVVGCRGRGCRIPELRTPAH